MEGVKQSLVTVSPSMSAARQRRVQWVKGELRSSTSGHPTGGRGNAGVTPSSKKGVR